MSHADVCRASAAWALRQSWCDVAAIEQSLDPGRPKAPRADVLAFLTPRKQQRQAERYRRWASAPARPSGYRGTKPYQPRPTVAIIEAKWNRSDLLSDLRAEKMLRYEPSASRVYLALHRRCWLDSENTSDRARVQALAGLGLPSWWGVIRVVDWTTRKGQHVWEGTSIRSARAYDHGVDPSTELRDTLVHRVAVSLSARMSRG